MAKIDKAVDRLIDERPGAELLLPRYDDPAHPWPTASGARAGPRPPT